MDSNLLFRLSSVSTTAHQEGQDDEVKRRASNPSNAILRFGRNPSSHAIMRFGRAGHNYLHFGKRGETSDNSISDESMNPVVYSVGQPDYPIPAYFSPGLYAPQSALFDSSRQYVKRPPITSPASIASPFLVPLLFLSNFAKSLHATPSPYLPLNPSEYSKQIFKQLEPSLILDEKIENPPLPPPSSTLLANSNKSMKNNVIESNAQTRLPLSLSARKSHSSSLHSYPLSPRFPGSYNKKASDAEDGDNVFLHFG